MIITHAMLLLERKGILYVNNESFDEWKKRYSEDEILRALDAVIEGQVSRLGLIRLRKRRFMPDVQVFLPIIQERKDFIGFSNTQNIIPSQLKPQTT